MPFYTLEIGVPIACTDLMVQRESKRHLDQIPFTAKKLKPPVLRKDYWEPLCMISFGEGNGMVGQNVFQKLREYRRLHELSWGWQAEDLIKMNKLQRGKTIHNQRRNAIADIAAALAGKGKGNLMWTTVPREGKPEQTFRRLRNATIYWTNDSDLNWASKWTPNVDHQIGLPDDVKVPRWKTRNFYLESEPEPEPEPESVTEEAATDGKAETTVVEGAEPGKMEPKQRDSEKEPEEKKPEKELEEKESLKDEHKAEEKTEQSEEKEAPVGRGILGSIFGRKS